MKGEKMIANSLADTDAYMLTTLQVILHKYASTVVRYKFKWRNWDQMNLKIPLKDFVGRIKKEIDHLCTLRFAKDELEYLEAIPHFKPDFIEYLRLFQFNRSYVRVSYEDNELRIEAEGPWASVKLFELPILYIVSELYTKNCGQHHPGWVVEGRKRLQEKLSYLDAHLDKDEPFTFADFGTRRRASADWHKEVIATNLSHPRVYIVGTSNILLAKETGLVLTGTMDHSFLQAHQQLEWRLVDSQKAALQAWADEYRGELGIALSDVIGFDAFLKDFDRYFSLLFDGCRHDSGNPVWWSEKLIAHYKKLRIDPKTKTAVYSDGLDFKKPVYLFKRFWKEIKTAFGIGTYLTNDCGFIAPQIVMKMVECNGQPVAKVPDSPGKQMCEDDEFLEYFKKVIREKK